MRITLRNPRFWILALGLAALGCVPFGGKPDEPPIHRHIDISDCRIGENLRLCIETADAGDSPAHAYAAGSFELTLRGPIRLKGKDTTVAGHRLPFEFLDKGLQHWDGGDSVALSGGTAIFRACIRDVSDAVLCDSVSVSVR